MASLTSPNAGARLASPEEIAVGAGRDTPFLRLPERGVFAERELRLRERAAGHAMRDYLLFAAELARAQHEALQDEVALALPDAGALEDAARAGRAPLPALGWPRDAAWRALLRAVAGRLEARLGGGPAQSALTAVRRLLALDDDAIERQADLLLAQSTLGLDVALAPLVGAGLQVCWTRLVQATQAAHGADRIAPFGRTDAATLCPCCASRPTASVTRIGGDGGGHRYLHCSLCSAQWHMVRIKCSFCEGTKGIHYQSLQARDGDAAPREAVQAECCESCGHYLKIVQMQRDPHVEPVADDLASLTLDLLVAEAGLARHGVNLLLLFGDDEDAGSGPGSP